MEDMEHSETGTMFSIIMCARNAEKLMRRAIDSVRMQTYAGWEMIILDNGSSDGTWNVIEEMVEADPRIQGHRLDKGVGWAKGTSICLKYATGRYMTFLAADDFLMGPGALQAVVDAARENPQIIFCGYACLQASGNAYDIVGGQIPGRRIYSGSDKIQQMYEIMATTYYNSMFHYTDVAFLRKYGMDFYRPFLGDNETMTEAICKAEKMVVLDQAVYGLTMNTSQTRGGTCLDYATMQWKSIRKALVQNGVYDKAKLKYIAIRIFNNTMAKIKAICDSRENGPEIRDDEMNPIQVSYAERISFLERLLSQEETVEMFYYADNEAYEAQIFEAAKEAAAQCMKEDGGSEKIGASWLGKLVRGLCVYDGEQFSARESFDLESYQDVHGAICCAENRGVFGFGLLMKMGANIPQEAMGLWQEISTRYLLGVQERIEGILALASEIAQRGRISEVIVMAHECLDLFQTIAPYLGKEDAMGIVGKIRQLIPDA